MRDIRGIDRGVQLATGIRGHEEQSDAVGQLGRRRLNEAITIQADHKSGTYILRRKAFIGKVREQRRQLTNRRRQSRGRRQIELDAGHAGSQSGNAKKLDSNRSRRCRQNVAFARSSLPRRQSRWATPNLLDQCILQHVCVSDGRISPVYQRKLNFAEQRSVPRKITASRKQSFLPAGWRKRAATSRRSPKIAAGKNFPIRRRTTDHAIPTQSVDRRAANNCGL